MVRRAMAVGNYCGLSFWTALRIMIKGKAIRARDENMDITTDVSKSRNKIKRGSQKSSKGAAHHPARPSEMDKMVSRTTSLSVSMITPLLLRYIVLSDSIEKRLSKVKRHHGTPSK